MNKIPSWVVALSCAALPVVVGGFVAWSALSQRVARVEQLGEDLTRDEDRMYKRLDRMEDKLDEVLDEVRKLKRAP